MLWCEANANPYGGLPVIRCPKPYEREIDGEYYCEEHAEEYFGGSEDWGV